MLKKTRLDRNKWPKQPGYFFCLGCSSDQKINGTFRSCETCLIRNKKKAKKNREKYNEMEIQNK